jgi:hypothetical protein
MIKSLSLLVLAVSIRSAAPASVASGPPGCFRVTFSNWQNGGEGKAFYEPLPSTLDLRNALDSDSRDSSHIGYRSPRGPEGTSRIDWRRVSRDTIAISLPRGWSAGLGLRVVDRPSAGMLIGSLEDYADYSPRTTLRARVRLTRISCP